MGVVIGQGQWRARRFASRTKQSRGEKAINQKRPLPMLVRNLVHMHWVLIDLPPVDTSSSLFKSEQQQLYTEPNYEQTMLSGFNLSLSLTFLVSAKNSSYLRLSWKKREQVIARSGQRETVLRTQRGSPSFQTTQVNACEEGSQCVNGRGKVELKWPAVIPAHHGPTTVKMRLPAFDPLQVILHARLNCTGTSQH